MRVVANEDEIARHCVVLLDGKKVLCTEADDTLGYVNAYQKDALGHWWVVRQFGKVEILDIRTMSAERKSELDIKD